MSIFNQPTIEELGGVTETTSAGSKKLTTDFYAATIKQAYIQPADTGAEAFVTVLTIDSMDYTFRNYVTSGRDKGNKNTYTKDDKEYPLPGFNIASQIIMLAMKSKKHSFKTLDKKEITIQVNNNPVKVISFPQLEDQVVGFIIAEVENSYEKVNVSTGQTTIETNTRNEIKAVCHPVSKMTITEITDKKETAAVVEAFLSKFKGVVLPSKASKAKPAQNKIISLTGVTTSVSLDDDFA